MSDSAFVGSIITTVILGFWLVSKVVDRLAEISRTLTLLRDDLHDRAPGSLQSHCSKLGADTEAIRVAIERIVLDVHGIDWRLEQIENRRAPPPGDEDDFGA